MAVAREYKYMCSDPGQELIRQDIRDHDLNRIMVAACSPHLHEKTFRNAVAEAGLNPYYFHMVNLREHDSWVHADKQAATEKAMDLVRAAVRRVKWHVPLERRQVPIHSEVLVVGGGIAGIDAALTLANAGKHVYLVEREPTIGGHMAQFDKTFPTLDCAACILTPKMTAVKEPPQHHAVDVFRGPAGGRLRRQLRGEGPPQAALRDRGPVRGLPGVHPGLRLQAGQDPRRVQPGAGQAQADLHSLSAGRAAGGGHRSGNLHRVQEREVQEDLRGGLRRAATPSTSSSKRRSRKSRSAPSSWRPASRRSTPRRIPYYGYGLYPNVYTSLEIERLVNASGPTGGEVVLRDGRKPETVGIVHCVGSRDENTNRYCSRVCCMYSLKLAHLIKEKTGAEVYNFYIDMRAPGKGFEEFYNRVAEEGVQLHPRQGGGRLSGLG